MTYVLEKIKLEDHELILDNAKNIKSWKKRIASCLKDYEGRSAWAFDKKTVSYLITLPLVSSGETLDRYYLFFDGSKTFVLICNSASSHDFSFDSASEPDACECARIVAMVSEAFVIYGRHGFGPLNRRGKPTEVVNPKFKEGV